MHPDLTIRDFIDADAAAFYAINAEWIDAMFVMEGHDAHVLSHPRETILNPGGVILMAFAGGRSIGACALMKTAPGVYELTKMGVSAEARGMKAGEALLRAMLDRVAIMDVTRLYLLTNSACAPAIHLYEKLGFTHDPDVMRDFGATYDRCDIAMTGPLLSS